MMPPDLIAVDTAMRDVVAQAERVASFATTTVLIEGETGTGKEMIARHIHKCSQFNGHPFVVLDCSMIPETLIESVLFGHEKGAFTGAMKATEGIVAQAQGGTLFLDEVSNLSEKAQVVLLRFLETHEIIRVGSETPQRIGLRLISATNQNLCMQIQAGRFRHDLFHRISTYKIWIPPLRHRVEDVMPLMNYYLQYWARHHKERDLSVAESTSSHLRDYSWPGNVRELRNASEHFVINVSSDYIEPLDFLRYTAEDKVQELLAKTEIYSGRLSDRHFLRAFVYAWTVYRGNVRRTADSLGISIGAVSKYSRLLELQSRQ